MSDEGEEVPRREEESKAVEEAKEEEDKEDTSTVTGDNVVGTKEQIIYSPWQGDIDLNTKLGKLLWNEGITLLETKFTGQSKDVIRFLADVQNRVDKCFWHDIVTFYGKNLITQHGEIELTTIAAARGR